MLRRRRSDQVENSVIMKRCRWCNEKNLLYIKYHDEEWGVQRFDDQYLFEMLILEGFQAGLSWECVLNKRENFREAFDRFDVNKIAQYDDAKMAELAENAGISFVGSTIIYSFLQAVGIINSHEERCFLCI